MNNYKPEVGETCEYSRGGDWWKCTITYVCQPVIVFLDLEDDYCNASHENSYQFRPLKSPEDEEITVLKQELAEQVAYFEEFKICLQRGKTYPTNPSPKLLNKIKTDAVKQFLEWYKDNSGIAYGQISRGAKEYLGEL